MFDVTDSKILMLCNSPLQQLKPCLHDSAMVVMMVMGARIPRLQECCAVVQSRYVALKMYIKWTVLQSAQTPLRPSRRTIDHGLVVASFFGVAALSPCLLVITAWGHTCASPQPQGLWIDYHAGG